MGECSEIEPSNMDIICDCRMFGFMGDGGEAVVNDSI